MINETSHATVTDRIDLASKALSQAEGDLQSPDEYRELCIRALSLKIAQVIQALLSENTNLALSAELSSLLILTEPLASQESFTSTAEDDCRRGKELISRENNLFKLLRCVGKKLMLTGNYLADARTVAISGVRFAEQCSSNPLVKNPHVPFATVSSFLILTQVEILRNALKPASESLAKAKFALRKVKEGSDQAGNRPMNVLPGIGGEKVDVVDDECLDYLSIQVLHTEGLLHTATQEYEAALESHAHEIIATSRKYTLPMLLSPGYYEMANIFFKQKRLPLATSYYTRAAEIWLEWGRTKRSQGSFSLANLDFIDSTTALKTLQHIIDMYSSMNESVRNRDECLNTAKQALDVLKA